MHPPRGGDVPKSRLAHSQRLWVPRNMMKLLAVIGFLATIITKGTSLKCEQCHKSGPEASCTGPVAACPDESTACIQGLENNTFNGEVLLTAFKTCFVPSMPEISCTKVDHLLRTSQYILRFNAQCSMNNSPFKVPPLNNTLNGYKCPDCFNDKSADECISKEEIKCTGTQTECSDFRGTIQIPGTDIKEYSVKGCLTPGSLPLTKFLPGTKLKHYTIILHHANRV